MMMQEWNSFAVNCPEKRKSRGKNCSVTGSL
jgi:hypothetical protein